MLSWVEHEKCFITSSPGERLKGPSSLKSHSLVKTYLYFSSLILYINIQNKSNQPAVMCTTRGKRRS